MVLGHFIITEIDIDITLQPPIGNIIEYNIIEYFTEFTGNGYILAAPVNTI